MAEPDVILFALEHRSSIRLTLFVPTLSLSLSLVSSRSRDKGEEGGKRENAESGAACYGAYVEKKRGTNVAQESG